MNEYSFDDVTYFRCNIDVMKNTKKKFWKTVLSFEDIQNLTPFSKILIINRRVNTEISTIYSTLWDYTN